MSTPSPLAWLPRSFRAQLAGGVALLVALLAVSLSLALGALISRQSRGDEGAALRSVARNAVRALGDGLGEREREIRVMAESPTLWTEGLATERALQVVVLDRHGEPIYAPGRGLKALRSSGQKLPLEALDNAGAAGGHTHATVQRWRDGTDYLTSAVSLDGPRGANHLGWTIVARVYRAKQAGRNRRELAPLEPRRNDEVMLEAA